MSNEIIISLNSFDFTVLVCCAVLMLGFIYLILAPLIGVAFKMILFVIQLLGQITAGIVFCVGLVVTLMYLNYALTESGLIQYLNNL